MKKVLITITLIIFLSLYIAVAGGWEPIIDNPLSVLIYCTKGYVDPEDILGCISYWEGELQRTPLFARTIVRSTGKPITEKFVFPASVVGTHYLYIVNGDYMTGENRVSSAHMTFNSEPVLSESDLNMNVSYAGPILLYVEEGNTLEVKLRSSPDGCVTAFILDTPLQFQS